MIFLSEDNMASGQASYRLCKDNLYNRTIKVTEEPEGRHYLVETVDTGLTLDGPRNHISPLSPDFSWKHFTTLSEALDCLQAQYEASLKEGFKPLASPQM